MSPRFGESNGSPGTGHFSQVVWAASRRLGVGLASGGGKVMILSYLIIPDLILSYLITKVMVVANYDPAGNFVGKYKENVLAPVAV